MTFSLLTIPDFRVKFEDKSINKTIIMSNNTRIKSKKVDSTKTFIQKKFTNRDAFLLYSLILGNIFYTYFNVAFILSVAFTNVFIWPNLMWRGGNIFFDSTSHECWPFFLPGSRDCRNGQFLLIQWELLCRLTHSKRNQQYFVYPACSPSKRTTNFKSLQSCQLELIHLGNCFILS